MSPFAQAVQLRNEAAIRAMLEQGVPLDELNAKDAHGNTPINYLAAMGVAEDIILKMIGMGADVKVANKNGAMPLTHAVYSKMSPAVLRAMVGAGADPNYQNDSGGTALQIACVCKAGKDTIQTLVELGADVDLVNSHGHSPLTFAVRNHNDYEIIDMLAGLTKNINSQIDSDDPKYPGFTALHFAAGENMAAAAAVLITHGAETDIKNRDGFTPLQLADENTHRAMVSSKFAKFSVSNPPPADAKKPSRVPLRRTSLLTQAIHPPGHEPRAGSSGLEGVQEEGAGGAGAGAGEGEAAPAPAAE